MNRLTAHPKAEERNFLNILSIKFPANSFNRITDCNNCIQKYFMADRLYGEYHIPIRHLKI